MIDTSIIKNEEIKRENITNSHIEAAIHIVHEDAVEAWNF